MRAHVSHLLCSDWSSEKVLIGLLDIQRELEPIYQKRRCIGELFSNKLTEAWDNFSKCWQPWRRKQEGQTFESNFWVLCHGKFKYYIYSYYCSHILGFKAPDLCCSVFQHISTFVKLELCSIPMHSGSYISNWLLIQFSIVKVKQIEKEIFSLRIQLSPKSQIRPFPMKWIRIEGFSIFK